MKLIIQIPCYNEEQTLPQVIADLPKSIQGIDSIELLVIDDGSMDNTSATASQLGVDHIIRFKTNQGLARVFKAGIDACVKLGADIIVNTDADNQYCAADIPKLVEPIVKKEADMVIGTRPIDTIKEFSWMKKKLQKLGSAVIRFISNTNVPDATSGFRAFSREAALRINIFSTYTYTLESIIQAGENRLKMAYVPVKVNIQTRQSRLLKSIPHYLANSITTIVRIAITYRPLKYFFWIGSVTLSGGLALAVRFLIFYFMGEGSGHIQSLILSSILFSLGFQLIMFGLLADVVASNRKLGEDIQYRIKKIELGQAGNTEEISQ
ncbi:MAG: glycosyltransferase [Candidatus Auribacter fodinae]|uniref:Glycosyltransferase n=1 Tax=Candidatus Auribacter fodinae TaxID=2093366 RepID=A0A3A4RC28_9BACT|nr:MAG: glycosyltransferase [Candidatus Auribacter fodinae]